jgi:glycosyltransferase involved in cell wall biosynthesis
MPGRNGSPNGSVKNGWLRIIISFSAHCRKHYAIAEKGAPKKTMNILMIISKNNKYGAQRLFIEQVTAMVRLGHTVVVVGRGISGYIPEAIKAIGVPYYSIAMKGLKDLFFLRRLVLNYNVHIIHTMLDRADYFGLFTSWLTRRPLVSSMVVRRSHIGYRFADRVIIVSSMQIDLLRRIGVRADRITIVRPGIDLERYNYPVAEKREAWRQKLKIDRCSIVFCHISSIIPQKCHPVSIALTAECKRRGEEPLLIIAGDPLQGEYYESLVKMISDAGLEQNVFFTGWTSELPELLSLSHFTLLPSVHESFGLVLLEGMVAGTPIVARKGEGGADLIEEYGTGFLYIPEQGVAALAEQILALWHDRSRYAILSDRGRKIMENEYTMVRFGERIQDVYSAVLKSDKGQ